MRNLRGKQGRKSVRDTGNNQGSSGNLISLFNTHTHSWTKHEEETRWKLPTGGLSSEEEEVGWPYLQALCPGLHSRGWEGQVPPTDHMWLHCSLTWMRGPWGLESQERASVQPCHISLRLIGHSLSQPCPTTPVEAIPVASAPSSWILV